MKGIELQNYRCGFDDSQALPCFKFYVSLELVDLDLAEEKNQFESI